MVLTWLFLTFSIVANYSTTQPQVNKCVQVTRITRNITCKCQTWVWAMHCPHASRNSRALNSRILTSTCKRTRNRTPQSSRVLAIEFASTRKYSQLNSRVLAIELANTRYHSLGCQFLSVCHAIILITGSAMFIRSEERKYWTDYTHVKESCKILLQILL